MRRRTIDQWVGFGSVVVCLALGACGSSSEDDSSGEGSSATGATGSGATSATGGAASGGAISSGGSSSSGSASGTGSSTTGSGGSSSGGITGTGGSTDTGGATSTGGTDTGGTTSSGGTTASGGTTNTGGTTATGGATGTGGTGGTTTCSGPTPTLAVTRKTTTGIAALGTPFERSNDNDGPTSWAAQYGQAPEIMPFASSDGLAVLFQDQATDATAHVVHITQGASGYAVDATYDVESLGRIMGFTRDTAGNYYVATGVDEDAIVDATYPPNDIHRPDIVRIVKFDVNGCVLMESDVDMERGKKKASSEIIVNPMVAATSRLVWGADRLLLVHGHNTEPDASIGGTRHQKAISTHLNALTGAVTRTDTMWVSHSFDQRAFYDGTGFVELHLGDAYPRAVTFGRYSDSEAKGGYRIYRIKGELGANNTYTRLGGVVPLTDATYGYAALFATERTTDASTNTVGSTRDLALVRVRRNFAQSNDPAWVIDDGAGTTEHSVSSSGTSEVNHVRWLTNLGANVHAERPRIVATADDEFVVLWERWTQNGNQTSFAGTYAMRIDGAGAVLGEAKALTGADHIVRGDDAVALGGKAIYVTGDKDAKTLVLNLVSSDLSYARVVLP